MLEIGKIGVKLQIIPQMLTKICTPGSSCAVIAQFALMLAVQYSCFVFFFYLQFG